MTLDRISWLEAMYALRNKLKEYVPSVKKTRRGIEVVSNEGKVELWLGAYALEDSRIVAGYDSWGRWEKLVNRKYYRYMINHITITHKDGSIEPLEFRGFFGYNPAEPKSKSEMAETILDYITK